MIAQLSQDSLVVIIGMAVVGSLSSAVVYLFTWLMKANSNTQEKLEKFVVETKADLDECRKDREVLHAKIHDLVCTVRRESA